MQTCRMCLGLVGTQYWDPRIGYRPVVLARAHVTQNQGGDVGDWRNTSLASHERGLECFLVMHCVGVILE